MYEVQYSVDGVGGMYIVIQAPSLQDAWVLGAQEVRALVGDNFVIEEVFEIVE